MFTGIIEKVGIVKDIQHRDEQVILTVSSELSAELKVDQSIANNGICLTVTNCDDQQFTVCAVQETIDKTTIGNWQINEPVNLERGMKMNARLDGHIVQGHVDTVGKCANLIENNENRTYTFLFDQAFAALIVEKGSVVVNGVSLTCYNVTENTFQVTIIPYTFENTTFKKIKVNDAVNLEFDILDKYFQRHLSLNR